MAATKPCSYRKRTDGLIAERLSSEYVAIRPIVAPVRVSRVSRRSWGGLPFSDGIDGAASMVVNFSNYSVEVIEREYPLRIEEYGFLPDSGGPGKFRAGLALVRRYRFLEQSGTFQIRADRSRFAPMVWRVGCSKTFWTRRSHLNTPRTEYDVALTPNVQAWKPRPRGYAPAESSAAVYAGRGHDEGVD